MANDHPTLHKTSNTEWDKAWDVVSRLGAARKLLEQDTGAAVHRPPTAVTSEAASIRTAKRRRLHRSLAVWILIGALWISIGMIVSAAIVTVAYLA
jgi:hypothetical protein